MYKILFLLVLMVILGSSKVLAESTPELLAEKEISSQMLSVERDEPKQRPFSLQNVDRPMRERAP